MADQGLQITAALALLATAGLARLRLLHTTSLAYLLLNALGSEVLAMSAWAGHQWGVLILEGAWSLIAAAGLAHTINAVLDHPGNAGVAILHAPATPAPEFMPRWGSRR
jgi:hypothetical protein